MLDMGFFSNVGGWPLALAVLYRQAMGKTAPE
jgi:hypothetical protein